MRSRIDSDLGWPDCGCSTRTGCWCEPDEAKANRRAENDEAARRAAEALATGHWYDPNRGPLWNGDD